MTTTNLANFAKAALAALLFATGVFAYAAENQSHLYTSTNDPGGNIVVVMKVGNGGIEQTNAYRTRGVGDADDGDFDSQSAMRIIGDYLLVVNAGDARGESGIRDGHGSVSVFRVMSGGAKLDRVDQDASTDDVQNIDSGGIRPVSIDYLHSDGATWILVANQHSNPLCLTPKDGGDVNDCTNQYGKQIGQSLANSDQRNVRVFKLSDGVLTPASGGVTFNSGLHGGPAQVAFSPDGRHIAVGLWGIPHLAALANPAYQSASRVYLYDANISSTGIAFENPRFYEETGVSGTIGFSWGLGSDYIYATNFNVAEEKSEHSITALGVADAAAFSSGGGKASGTGELPGHGEEACWSWMSSDGKLLYAASFSQNSLSVFDVAGAHLTHRTSVLRRGTAAPDTKDIFVTADNQYAYVSGAYNTHTMTVFDVLAGGGVLERQHSPYPVRSSHPGGRNVSNTKHAYLGLIGYPESYVGY